MRCRRICIHDVAYETTLRIADVLRRRRKDISASTTDRVRISHHARHDVVTILIVAGEAYVLEHDQTTVRLTYLIHTDRVDGRFTRYLSEQLRQRQRIVLDQAAIRRTDHMGVVTEDRTWDTSRCPTYLLRSVHRVDIIVIRRYAELRLVRITTYRQSVTTDDDLLSHLVQTVYGTHINGDTQVLLLTVNDLLDSHRFVEVTGIIIGRDATTDIDTATIRRQRVHREEVETVSVGGTVTILAGITPEITFLRHVFVQELMKRIDIVSFRTLLIENSVQIRLLHEYIFLRQRRRFTRRHEGNDRHRQ